MAKARQELVGPDAKNRDDRPAAGRKKADPTRCVLNEMSVRHAAPSSKRKRIWDTKTIGLVLRQDPGNQPNTLAGRNLADHAAI